MDPHSVDIEGTVPSPAVLFQRIYNVEKTIYLLQEMYSTFLGNVRFMYRNI